MSKQITSSLILLVASSVLVSSASHALTQPIPSWKKSLQSTAISLKENVQCGDIYQATETLLAKSDTYSSEAMQEFSHLISKAVQVRQCTLSPQVYTNNMAGTPESQGVAHSGATGGAGGGSLNLREEVGMPVRTDRGDSTASAPPPPQAPKEQSPQEPAWATPNEPASTPSEPAVTKENVPADPQDTVPAGQDPQEKEEAVTREKTEAELKKEREEKAWKVVDAVQETENVKEPPPPKKELSLWESVKEKASNFANSFKQTLLNTAGNAKVLKDNLDRTIALIFFGVISSLALALFGLLHIRKKNRLKEEHDQLEEAGLLEPQQQETNLGIKAQISKLFNRR